MRPFNSIRDYSNPAHEQLQPFVDALDDVGEVSVGRDAPLTEAVLRIVPDGSPPLEEVVSPDAALRDEAVVMLSERRKERHKRLIRAGLSHIPYLEACTLRWLYGLDGDKHSRNEVARRLGLSRTQVWNIEQRALAALHEAVELAAERRRARRRGAYATRRAVAQTRTDDDVAA